MVHAMLVMRAWLVNSLRAQATRSSHLARRAHTSSGLRRSSQRMTEKIHQRDSSLKVSGRLETVGFLCPCTLPSLCSHTRYVACPSGCQHYSGRNPHPNHPRVCAHYEKIYLIQNCPVWCQLSPFTLTFH